MDYTPIIGLEIHVELKTKSKMFCGCKADYFGQKPNTHTCPVCLGLPGALPVPNKKAIEWCIKIGQALNCQIPLESKFDRKNYFYPDLSKGYQISQYDEPFCKNGWLKVKTQKNVIPASKERARPESMFNSDSGVASLPRMTGEKTIRIRRVHMEEDTGKLIHGNVNGEKCTLIDFNRSGVPLVEIVTEPDIRSSEEARVFLKKLHQIIRYLGVSDADMEKGSMRLEPNISVKMHNGQLAMHKKEFIEEKELPKYKVEIKNINSFNFAKKAIDYEIARHIELLDIGETPKQETRGWDEKKAITYSQRSKEEAHDYRYFPEPDIPPIEWTENFIRQLADQIPELPDMRIARFMKDYGLSEYDASILIDDKNTSEYFEESIENLKKSSFWQGGAASRISVEKQNTDPGHTEIKDSSARARMTDINPKIIANWIINKKVDISKVSPNELIKLITSKQQKPQMDASELDSIIKKVIEANPKAVSDYKSGKVGTIMFLVGQVMRESKGKADASQVKTLLQKLLQ